MKMPNLFSLFKKRGKLSSVAIQKEVGDDDDDEFSWRDILSGFNESTTFATQYDYLKLYNTHWLIYAAVYITSNAIAQLPFIFLDENGELAAEENEKVILIRKILQRPNAEQTWTDLIEKTVIYMELTGNAYWELVKGEDGKLATIYSLNPSKISVNRDYRRKIINYTYLGEWKRNILSLEDIIHFYYQSSIEDEIGTSPIESLVPDLILNLYLNHHYQAFFKNAAIPCGVLQTEQTLNPATYNRLVTSWKKFYGGVTKHFKTIILDTGLKYNPIATLPKDIPFAEIEERFIKKVLAVLNVPPLLVGILSDASYANARQQYRIFWEGIMSKSNRLAKTISYILLPLVGMEGYKFKFDFSKIEALQEDKKIQAEIHKTQIISHIKTPNEVRKELGLEPIEGGDEFFVGFEKAGRERDIEITRSENIRMGYEEWFNFVKIVEPIERNFSLATMQVFRRQKKEVLDNLEKYFERKDIQNIIFDTKKTEKLLAEKVKSVYQQAIEEVAKATIEEIKRAVLKKRKEVKKQVNLDYEFNINNPSIIKWIEVSSKNFSFFVDETTIKILQEELRKGFEGGETIKEIAERVKMTFSDLISLTGSRAVLMARTEITAASNYIKDNLFKDMGVPKKQWVASFGAPTPPRLTHLAAHLQIVKSNEKFLVGGEYLDYPGDPSASGKERCNCRCTMKSILA